MMRHAFLLRIFLLLFFLALGAACGESGPGAILIVFDASQSMISDIDYETGDLIDVNHEKFLHALNAVDRYLEGLPEETPVGLRTFGDAAYCVPGDPTGSRLEVPIQPGGKRLVQAHLSRISPFGGTDIAGALTGAIDDFAGIPGKKTLVLISDGRGNDPQADLAAARRLAERYPELTGHIVSLEADAEGQQELNELARILGGKFRQTTRNTLTAALIELEGEGRAPTPLTTAWNAVLPLFILGGVVLVLWGVKRRYPHLYAGALLPAGGGVVAWILTEPIVPPAQTTLWRGILQMGLYSGIVGAVLGGVLGGAEGFLNRTWRRAWFDGRRMILVGLLGGIAGGMVGQGVYAALSGYRWIGWGIVGTAIGAVPGIAAGMRRRAARGALAGLLAGIVAGMLFDPLVLFLASSARIFEQGLGSSSQHPLLSPIVSLLGKGHLSRLFALMLIGWGVGIAVGIAEEIAKVAWLILARGEPEGRRFILEKGESWIGSNERADVPLLGDPAVRDRHAVIRREGDRFVIVALGDAPLFVGGERVSQRTLATEDLIDIGEFRLIFRERRGEVGADAPEEGDAEPLAAFPSPVISPPEGERKRPPAHVADDARADPHPVRGEGKSAAPPPARPWGYLLQGDRSFDLSKREIVIGREEGDILLSDPSVSPRHALIKRIRGEVFLYDPWSEQGTYLDGARITKKTPLTDGAK
ncbi:MAG: FHA domain-containing protein, partial [Deltaproteobacteria bacterium]